MRLILLMILAGTTLSGCGNCNPEPRAGVSVGVGTGGVHSGASVGAQCGGFFAGWGTGNLWY